MRTVPPAVVGLFVLLSGAAIAQPAPPAPLPAIPSLPNPIPAPPADPTGLPGGTNVSQPLQPVVMPQAAVSPVPSVVDSTLAEATNSAPATEHVLGGWWDSDEVLVWWPKAHPLPPLVTGTRVGAPPVLGGPSTAVLVGTRAIDTQDSTGGRFTLGFSLNSADTVGLEARYFFLGSRTLSESVTDFGTTRYRTLGLPYVNALTGQEDVLTVARPGERSALVSVFTTTRVQGVEVNGVANLIARPGLKVHGIVGYRFLQLQEGLRVEQTTLQYPTPAAFNLQTLGVIADQFSTSSRFSGGQVGLHTEVTRGAFYTEVVGKVALGQSYEVLRIEGQSNLITAANPLPLLRSYPGGMYTQLSNMGRTTRSVFAVAPEATVKFGLKGDRGRIFIGYNFLYLSDAIRPGDQVDRTINPTQIPLLNGGGTFAGPDRPRATIAHGDFWVQGLIVGLETRY